MTNISKKASSYGSSVVRRIHLGSRPHRHISTPMGYSDHRSDHSGTAMTRNSWQRTSSGRETGRRNQGTRTRTCWVLVREGRGGNNLRCLLHTGSQLQHPRSMSYL